VHGEVEQLVLDGSSVLDVTREQVVSCDISHLKPRGKVLLQVGHDPSGLGEIIVTPIEVGGVSKTKAKKLHYKLKFSEGFTPRSPMGKPLRKAHLSSRPGDPYPDKHAFFISGINITPDTALQDSTVSVEVRGSKGLVGGAKLPIAQILSLPVGEAWRAWVDLFKEYDEDEPLDLSELDWVVDDDVPRVFDGEGTGEEKPEWDGSTRHGFFTQYDGISDEVVSLIEHRMYHDPPRFGVDAEVLEPVSVTFITADMDKAMLKRIDAIEAKCAKKCAQVAVQYQRSAAKELSRLKSDPKYGQKATVKAIAKGMKRDMKGLVKEEKERYKEDHQGKKPKGLELSEIKARCEANIKSVYLESDTYKSFMERKTLRQYMTASIVERLRSQALVTMYDLQLDLLHEMCGVYVSMADSKAEVSALERAAFLERGTALQKQQEKALAEYYTGLSVSTAIFRPEFDFTNHWQAYEVLANRAEVFVDTSDGAAPVGLQDLAASSDKGTGKKKKKTPKLTSKVAKKVAKKELKRRHSSVLLTADEVFGIIEGASRGAQDDSRRASSSSGVFSDADQGSDSDASESTTNSYMKKSSSAMKEGFPALEESPLEQRGTSDAAVPGADGSDDDDDAEYGFDP